MKKAAGALISALLVVASVPGMALAGGPRRPANDDLAGAVLITELPFTASVSNKGASVRKNEVQPSCQTMRSTVWYRFAAVETMALEVELTSAFSSAIAIYEETADSLLETGCLQGSPTGEFDVESGKSYLVQLGSAGKAQGRVDLSVAPSVWKEVSVFEHTYEREAEEQHIPIVKVTGAPREANPSMYDVTMGIGDQTPTTIGLMTFGLVTQKIEQELLRIPASTHRVTLKIVGRYDSSQYTCAADDGNGGCYAGSPLNDLGWLSGGEGSRAELVVSVLAERNGEVVAHRTQALPYAGQIFGLLP